jgi:NAD(P)-dependent dehydrogenase (short-subunit alcohol dehydrogenase family)
VFRRRVLEGSTVVVIGASSGVGRAAARQFAGHRAQLVLVGRNGDHVEAVAAECRARGATAVPVVADVGNAAQVQHVADVALATFGRVDTWVNVAAGLLAGPIDQLPLAEIEQLVRTNVMGSVIANRTAIAAIGDTPHGVIVNVSSLLGVVPNPVVPAYTMTKAAIRSLSLCLHHSPLRSHIRVCTVLPGPIDTPMFDQAGNHVGRRLRSVPPACAPERAAAVIVGCARRPRRQVPVGFTARIVLLGTSVWPALTERMVARYSGRLLLTGESAPATAGNLFEPTGQGHVDGGWRRGRLRRRLGAAVGDALAAR